MSVSDKLKENIILKSISTATDKLRFGKPPVCAQQQKNTHISLTIYLYSQTPTPNKHHTVFHVLLNKRFIIDSS